MTKPIKFPVTQKNLGYPLMQALDQRRSVRKWDSKPVSMQDISNLLWAACGISKEKRGKTKSKRTAPSGCNSQEIRVYVLLPEGVFRYEEEAHMLQKHHSKDIRAQVGRQKMMQSAPMGLVYVADLSRMTSPLLRSLEAKRFTAWVDTGFISQNVYLYCAAANMATVALMLIDRIALREKLALNEDQKIVMTQAVGYRQKQD